MQSSVEVTVSAVFATAMEFTTLSYEVYVVSLLSLLHWAFHLGVEGIYVMEVAKLGSNVSNAV